MRSLCFMCVSLVAMNTWMRRRAAASIASQQRSTSLRAVRDRPQITGPRTPVGDGLDGLEVALAGDREAGLDDVDAEAGQLLGDLELLALVERDAWRLLAVAQGRVEDDQPVGRLPCRGLGVDVGVHEGVPFRGGASVSSCGRSGECGGALRTRAGKRREPPGPGAQEVDEHRYGGTRPSVRRSSRKEATGRIGTASVPDRPWTSTIAGLTIPPQLTQLQVGGSERSRRRRCPRRRGCASQTSAGTGSAVARTIIADAPLAA